MPRKTAEKPVETTPPAAIAAAEKLMEKPKEEAKPEPVADGKPAADVLREVIEENQIHPDEDIKSTITREELLVDLGTDALIAKANEFARLHAELGSHETHAKMVKDGLKAKESRINEQISKLADEIRAKKELRMVDVEHVLDFKTNSYVEIRKDTGAEIPGSKRALTETERKAFLDARQKKLPLEEAKKSDFTAPKDPLKAAAESELTGAPVNSGKASQADDEEPCEEKGCVLIGPHATHEDADGNNWSTPGDLKHLREESDG
jgi:hypothetical protein